MQGLKKYWAAALVIAVLLFCTSSTAQETGEKAPPEAGDRSAPGAPAESYLERQRKQDLLAPYQPGQIPGLPGYGSDLGGVPPRSGSAAGPGKPKPLPSLLDPWERRKKRLPTELEGPAPGSSSSNTTSPDLATSRLSREGVYRVSYSGDKPNSYGVPFNWQVRITDSNGLPIKGANLSLRLSMPASGHSPVITGIAVREVGGGLYKINGIRLDRAGLWRAALEVHGRGYGDMTFFNLMVP